MTILKEKHCSNKKRVLIIIETSRVFGRKLIEGINQFATEHKNWNIFICDHDLASRNPSKLDMWNGDGCIIRGFNKNLNQFFHRFDGSKINLAADGQEFPIYVRLDNTKCGELAAAHFWERGYRNFAYFSMGHARWSQLRCECFAAALKQYNAECFLAPQIHHKNLVTLPTLWHRGLDSSVLRWLRSLPKPVGIFCAYDNHAFYLTSICNYHGIAVPEEAAILGVDNDESMCRSITPALSSIDPNAKRIGYLAAETLDRMMVNRLAYRSTKGTFNEETPIPIFVEPSHIAVRQSTDNIAVDNPMLVKALRFIRQEVAQNIRVSDVAKEVGVSRGTLNNIFEEYLHSTPIREILRVRIDWAKQLLRETTISITEIAVMIGYQTPEYFSRAFSRETGESPREYRTRVANQE
ncbi:XylR family transcriptional regulator [Planctomycetales bacterium]|nr:XylR family transcriptional regulator [Planctomycetales bacterium]